MHAGQKTHQAYSTAPQPTHNYNVVMFSSVNISHAIV